MLKINKQKRKYSSHVKTYKETINMMRREMEDLKNNANTAYRDEKYSMGNEKYSEWELLQFPHWEQTY